ncbi:MAG: hypothetical protein R2822_30470 [Spirosomataceae bacterium]
MQIAKQVYGIPTAVNGLIFFADENLLYSSNDLIFVLMVQNGGRKILHPYQAELNKPQD